VDKDKAQDQLKAAIEARAKTGVQYVRCPGGVKAEKGATFRCLALIPVNVTQVDDNGNLRWQITSFSGPPIGATGATGATGLAGATGATTPGIAGQPGAAGGQPGAAGARPGAQRDDPRFDRYTSRSEGYTISHPLLWKRSGADKDVTFAFPGGSRFIHLLIQPFPNLPTVSAMRKSLREQANVRAVQEVKRDRIDGEPVLYAQYLVKAPNARVALVIKRYVFATKGKRALIEVAANQPLADNKPLVKKFDRAIRSFRWLSSGT
jgi:hypothetical protein